MNQPHDDAHALHDMLTNFWRPLPAAFPPLADIRWGIVYSIPYIRWAREKTEEQQKHKIRQCVGHVARVLQDLWVASLSQTIAAAEAEAGVSEAEAMPERIAWLRKRHAELCAKLSKKKDGKMYVLLEWDTFVAQF